MGEAILRLMPKNFALVLKNGAADDEDMRTRESIQEQVQAPGFWAALRKAFTDIDRAQRALFEDHISPDTVTHIR